LTITDGSLSDNTCCSTAIRGTLHVLQRTS
jgi:hypothetical protein